MPSFRQPIALPQGWSNDALSIAAQAKVLSGNKLEQLVIRLQRNTGRSKTDCWRFVIQYGLKDKVEYRRWTPAEIEMVREEVVKRSVEDIADKLQRSPKAVRSMLQRHGLHLREMRSDMFSVESLAAALRVRKSEILFWIEQGWLKPTLSEAGGVVNRRITPEALTLLYRQHLPKLLKRGLRNQSLFEAYQQYCFAPKHTVGEQLLDVRRDKRERLSYAASRNDDSILDDERDHGYEEDEEDYQNVEMSLHLPDYPGDPEAEE